MRSDKMTMIKKVIPTVKRKHLDYQDVYFGTEDTSKYSYIQNDKNLSFIQNSFEKNYINPDFEVNITTELFIF